MTVLKDDREQTDHGGVTRASLVASATTDPSRVAAPAIQSDRPPDQSPGDVDGDGTAADAGSANDARLREARERADRYLAELISEVGEPSPEDVAEAEAWATRIDQALEKARAAQCEG